MWCNNELPKPSASLDVLKADLDDFGYCIIEKVLDEERLSVVRERLSKQAEAERMLHEPKNPANVVPSWQWVGMLLNK